MDKRRLFALALSAALLAGCGGPGHSSSGSGSGSGSGFGSGSALPSGEQAAGPKVRADWSVLGGRAQPLPAVGGRWYEEPVDRLLPRPDYGQLVPFQGAIGFCKVAWEEDTAFTIPTSFFGLMTVDGQVVLDPVCSFIETLAYTDTENGQVMTTHRLPVFRLGQGDPELGSPHRGDLVALAARDGSWCTDFQYWGSLGYPGGVAAGDGTSFSLIDARTGEVTRSWTWAQLGIDDPSVLPWMTGDGYESTQWFNGQFFLGVWGEAHDMARFLDPVTGAVTTGPARAWYEQCDQTYQSLLWWNWTVDPTGAVTLTFGERSHTFQSPMPEDDVHLYVDGDDRVVFIRRGDRSFAVTTLDGAVVLPVQKGELSVLAREEGGGGWFCFQPEGEKRCQVYGWDGALCATLPMDGASWCSLSGPLIKVVSETSAAYYRPETGECVFRTHFLSGD